MIRALALAIFLVFPPSPGAGENLVRIVVGFPPGAALDALARLLAQELRRDLDRPVLVHNRAGADGRMAAELVKAAQPDGATFLLTPVAPMAIYPHSFAGSLRYDPFRDFSPVAHLAAVQQGLGIAAIMPAHSLADYIALVRKNPRAGYYASPAVGSIPHYLGAMLARAAGIEMTHVPYKGNATVLQALATAEVGAALTSTADIATLVKSGKARLLATAGPRRAAAFPEVPTFKEAGYEIEGGGWYALFAPAGTAQAAIDRVAISATAAVRGAPLRQRLEGMGLEPTGLGPLELAAILKADYDKWGPVIRASGFKPAE